MEFNGRTLHQNCRTTNSLKRKGFRTENCLAYDSFLYCVSNDLGNNHKARNIFDGVFNDAHNKLFNYFRSLGGEVTLILGVDTEERYKALQTGEIIDLYEDRIYGRTVLKVWAEREGVRTSSK